MKKKTPVEPLLPVVQAIPAAVAPPALRMDVASLVQHFLSSRTPATMRAYKKDLETFAAFMGAESVDAAAGTFLRLHHGDANAKILDYRAFMEKEQNLAPASIGRRLAAVRTLVKLARLLGMVDWTIEVQSPRIETYRDTRGPGEETYEKMLGETRARKDPKGLRDFAILRLLHDLALRRGELVSLDMQDIDVEQGTLLVRGKGRTSKEPLTIPEVTMQALQAWLAARPAGKGSIFVSLDPRTLKHRLTTQAVYKVVKGYGLKAGSDVRPHGLRHLAGTTALDRTGGDVRKVAKFMRHRNVATTMIYDDRRQDEGGEVAGLVAGPVVVKKKKKRKKGGKR